MINDKENTFLKAISEMLIKYYTESKKFLSEKNAKLEVSYKKRKARANLLDSGFVPHAKKESKLSDLLGKPAEESK